MKANKFTTTSQLVAAGISGELFGANLSILAAGATGVHKVEFFNGTADTDPLILVLTVSAAANLSDALHVLQSKGIRFSDGLYAKITTTGTPTAVTSIAYFSIIPATPALRSGDLLF